MPVGSVSVFVDDLYEASDDGSFLLAVHAQPGAGRSAVVGRHGNAVKARVAAPPEAGRANDALVRLLEEVLGGKVELVSGEHSRTKRFHVTGVEPEDFARRLESALVAGSSPAGRAARDRRTPGRP
jgi:uncharacterized protein (TIGR00251 family)